MKAPSPVTSEPCPRGESVRLRTPQAAGGPVDPGAESLCRLLSRASETPSVRSTCGSFLRTASRPVVSCGKPARLGAYATGPLCSAPFPDQVCGQRHHLVPFRVSLRLGGTGPGTRPDTTVQLSRPTISPADDRGSYFICSLGISGRGLAPGEQQHKMTGSWPRHDLLPELRPLGPGSGLRGPALHSDSDERPLRSGRPGVVGPRSPWPCVFLGRKADRNVCLLSAQFHRY